MTTHNSSLANLCRGVGERVLYTDSRLTKPIIPEIGIFESKLASYRAQLSKSVGFQSPVTHDQFVDFYKGPRRLTYSRAVAGLALLPVRPRDAMLKTFVKAEKINLSLKPDPVPRVIQPRDPRYNVEVGKYLRPVEKKIYEAIDDLFGSPTIMSSYNAFTLGRVLKDKWDNFIDPVCVGLDASRFDQHVSKQALKFEHKLYDMIFHSGELRRLLQLQLDNRGIAVAADGHFFYRKSGCRMSGDMNTSLGNKIIMCLMAKSFIDSKRCRIDFANNGDDCLMFLEKSDLKQLHNLTDYFKRFGFNIVLEKPVFEFEQLEFCQSKPVCCNNIWRMVRNVRTCISKDVTCVSLGHDVKQYRAWLFDVGTCGQAVASDVPVLGRFYDMLRRIGEEGSYQAGYKEYSWYRVASRGTSCVHPETDAYGRYSFWLSTGITPDHQVELEDYFNNAVWGGNERQLIIDLNILLNG